MSVVPTAIASKVIVTTWKLTPVTVAPPTRYSKEPPVLSNVLVTTVGNTKPVPVIEVTCSAYNQLLFYHYNHFKLPV